LNQQRTAENQRRSNENVTRIAAGKLPLPLLPVLMVGSGINTGLATVGLMGSDVRLNYTVFGREINLASRLESVSGRSRIIIGEATYAAISGDDPKLAATCVALPPEKVKGFRSAVKIYEVPWQMIISTLPVSDNKTSATSANAPEISPAEPKRA
jgi:class 3 adenylate cyclase